MEYIQFAILNWELSLALLVTSLMLAWNLYGHRIQGYEPITTEQAINVINRENPTILDIRETKELNQTGRINDAKQISLGKIASTTAGEIGDTKKPIIVVCRTGTRSVMACSKLKKKGFGKIYNLKGGISGWQKQGLPLTKN